jgi:hypothetical protein
MDLVLKCEADYGSNEHDIAIQLFVKRDQREMFLTLPTNEIRFQWFTRRYKDKYGREGWGGGHGYFQWLKIRCSLL